MKRMILSAAAAAVLACGAVPLSAQVARERVDLDVVARIRDEGLSRSQIPEMASYLTDVVGPRLTGSPGIRRAYDWTASTMRGWGLENVAVEPWGEFGRGWENLSVSMRALTPYAQPLEAWPVGWSGSTRGTVKGRAVIVDAQSAEDLAAYRGKLKGAFVLLQPFQPIEPEWQSPDRRASLDELLAPPAQTGAADADAAASRERMRAEWQKRRELRAAMDELFIGEKVAAILQPSRWTYGMMLVGGTRAYAKDAPVGPPELVLAHEDYGQIWRNVERGEPVELELNVANRWYDDDLQGYNVLADIPGTDLADQYVMIGGHIDSWHPGTGATDNAAGTVVMMEAMRILKTLGLPMRRTVRIGLWSAEEQGLIGSRRWVENHPELHDRISAYLNFDNGTGRIRGIHTQSNAAVVPVFEQLLWPFRDLGVVAVRNDDTGGTDHLSFDRAGIPGFQFIQDPIEYSFRTHHSNIDTYERLVIDDLEQSAVVVAALVYHLANRDEMLPRKPAEATAAAR